MRARALAEAAEVVPGAVVGVAMRRLGPLLATRRPVANVMVTNVPGPLELLYAFGARMIGLYGLGPIADGFGITHLVGSYAGVFSFSATGCREMLPDARFYDDQIDRALDDLRKATGVTASPMPDLVGADGPAEVTPDGERLRSNLVGARCATPSIAAGQPGETAFDRSDEPGT